MIDQRLFKDIVSESGRDLEVFVSSDLKSRIHILRLSDISVLEKVQRPALMLGLSFFSTR